MKLLKRENWWFWLVLHFITGGMDILLLGLFLDVYENDAWYTKWQYWLVGTLLMVTLPIMLGVLMLQTLANIAKKFGISGHEYYLSPYIWIICVIIPIFGWIIFAVMVIYLMITVLMALYQGKAEKFIKE